jgi:type VI secretion system protein ImpH
MAAESGHAGIAVDRNEGEVPMPPEFLKIRKMLDEEPFRVRFFQAVRMLQRMEPGKKPVGYFVSPEGEAIRFSSLPTLSFPPSQIYSLDRGADGQMQMTVQFMGVVGSISPMPPPYTEYLMGLMREKNFAMGQFFDIFNHRMISLFYRGWEKYRFFIGYERGAEDPVSPRMMDLLGLGVAGLEGLMGIPELASLNYFGLLAHHTRPAEGLRRVLQDYFEVPVAIHQFAGAWRTLPIENRTSFSGFGGASEILGLGVVAGDEVLDQHGRVRIAIGPMRFDRYLQFLPGQDANKELQSWFRFYANGNYEAEVQLILDRRDAPKCELGFNGKERPQLGYVSWLKTKPLGRDPSDATYLIQ